MEYKGYSIKITESKHEEGYRSCWYWEAWKDGEVQADNSHQYGETAEEDAIEQAKETIDWLVDDKSA